MEYTNRLPDSAISKRNMERYRAHFGTSPGVCALLWNEFSSIIPQKYCYKHLLWGLMFLKIYGTEPDLAGKIGVDEDTFRDHVWVIVRAIAFCKLRVEKEWISVQFNCGWNRLQDTATEAILERIWFSHKVKGPGLRYEVGSTIQTGCICWINGPFAPGAAWNDLPIFWLKLKTLLPPGEKVEADDGYCGDEWTSTPLDAQNMHESIMKDNAHCHHETVNLPLKQFNCLCQMFCHEIKKHVFCFEAVAVIVEMGIENGEPLYKINYYLR